MLRRRRRKQRPHHESLQRVALPPEGWCYLGVMVFVFLGALIRDINLLMLLFGLLAGPLVYSLWYGWFALSRLEIRRIVPKQVYAGEVFDVEIELANRHRWLGVWAILVQDRLTRCDAPTLPMPRDARLMFLYIAAGRSARLRYRVQFTARGMYQFGPLTVATRFPLGLIRRSYQVPLVDSLVVWPRLGKLNRALASTALATEQPSRHMQRRRGLVEGDFYGLRDWRAGDSRRWIHWRTSARMGQLMVRQFERHRAPDMGILVDLWQGDERSREQFENVELAVSFAATLVSDACRRSGRQVVLAIAGQQAQVIRGSSGSAILRRSLSALATAKATREDRLPAIFGQLASQLPSSSNTILITSRPSQAAGAAPLEPHFSEPRLNHWFAQIVYVQTDSQRLTDYFEAR